MISLQKSSRSLFPLAIFVLFFLPVLARADADIKIMSVSTSIVVSQDGTAVVDQQVKANVVSSSNDGGIYFDIPLVFKDKSGAPHWQDLTLLDAQRDGTASHYWSDYTFNGKNIFVGRLQSGKSPKRLPRGETTFRLVYRVNRIVTYEQQSDVVRLNMNFGGFGQTALKNNVSMQFPKAINAEDLSYDRKKYKDLKFVFQGNTVSINNTEPVVNIENMDVEIQFPSGSFQHPNWQINVWWWFSDHMMLILSLSGPLIGFYFVWCFGQKLKKRTVFHKQDFVFDLPDYISPGYAATVDQRWKQWRMEPILQAILVQLAIHGFIILSPLEGQNGHRVLGNEFAHGPTKQREAKPGRKLHSLELMREYINEQSAPKGDKAQRDMSYHDAILELKASVYSEGQSVRGRSARIPQVVMTTVLGSIAASTAFRGGFFIFSGQLLLLATLFAGGSVFVLMLRSFGSWSLTLVNLRSLKRRSEDYLASGVVVMILLSIWVAYLAYGYFPVPEQLPACLSVLFDTGCILAILKMASFPTIRQNIIASRVVCLKKYLMLSYEDRKTVPNVPEMSLKHFEKLLPYAIALGVHKEWMAQFDIWLERTGLSAYTPAWNSGKKPNFEPVVFARPMSIFPA